MSPLLISICVHKLFGNWYAVAHAIKAHFRPLRNTPFMTDGIQYHMRTESVKLQNDHQQNQWGWQSSSSANLWHSKCTKKVIHKFSNGHKAARKLSEVFHEKCAALFFSQIQNKKHKGQWETYWTLFKSSHGHHPELISSSHASTSDTRTRAPKIPTHIESPNIYRHNNHQNGFENDTNMLNERSTSMSKSKKNKGLFYRAGAGTDRCIPIKKLHRVQKVSVILCNVQLCYYVSFSIAFCLSFQLLNIHKNVGYSLGERTVRCVRQIVSRETEN